MAVSNTSMKVASITDTAISQGLTPAFWACWFCSSAMAYFLLLKRKQIREYPASSGAERG